MDSSALLSTCAGAGATLVAIIGGYLVSQALRVSSELAAARRLYINLDATATTNVGLADFDHTALVNEQLAVIVSNQAVEEALITRALAGDVGLRVDDLRRMVDVSEIEAIRLQATLDGWNEEVRNAVKSELFRQIECVNDPPTWKEFALQEAASNIATDPIWEGVYETMLVETCGSRRPRPPGPDREARIRGLAATHQTSSDIAVRSRLERDLAKAHLDGHPGSKGLVGSLVLLMVVFAVTVMPSVWYLTVRDQALAESDSALVLALFLGGVVLLFIYLLLVALLADKEPDQ